jgi:small-conductance mechanosensitive channel
MTPSDDKSKSSTNAAAQDGAGAEVNGAAQRTERWRDLSASLAISRRALVRARLHLLVYAPLFAAVIVIYHDRVALFGHAAGTVHAAHGAARSGDLAIPFQVGTVLLLILFGWALARDLGRTLGPMLLRRMDEATAGTIGFIVRLATLFGAILVALGVAEVSLAALAIGASFGAVVFGLAAQQTLGNLIAGTVLLTARPFRVGERVRLQGGPLAGQIEGTVSALGLLYTTFASGEDRVLIPNSAVLAVSVTPLREPEAVSLRARLRAGTTPIELQSVIEAALTIPLRARPAITLEELDGREVVVRISATPVDPAQGAQLASELLAVVSSQTRDAHQETA